MFQNLHIEELVGSIRSLKFNLTHLELESLEPGEKIIVESLVLTCVRSCGS